MRGPAHELAFSISTRSTIGEGDQVHDDGRAAEAHQRQRQAPLVGSTPRLTPMLMKAWHAHPDADALRDQAGEHAVERDRLAADVEQAPREPEEGDDDRSRRRSRTPRRSPRAGSRVRLGQVVQLLDAAAEPDAEDRRGRWRSASATAGRPCPARTSRPTGSGRRRCARAATVAHRDHQHEGHQQHRGDEEEHAPLTPPRNRMPIAIVAMTMKAPMSARPSSSRPTTPTATAIGSTAREEVLLHVHLAHHVVGGVHRDRQLGQFGRLEVHDPSGIQRRAPLTPLPMPGSARAPAAPAPRRTATATSFSPTRSPAPAPRQRADRGRRRDSTWRDRKCVARSARTGCRAWRSRPNRPSPAPAPAARRRPTPAPGRRQQCASAGVAPPANAAAPGAQALSRPPRAPRRSGRAPQALHRRRRSSQGASSTTCPPLRRRARCTAATNTSRGAVVAEHVQAGAGRATAAPRRRRAHGLGAPGLRARRRACRRAPPADRARQPARPGSSRRRGRSGRGARGGHRRGQRREVLALAVAAEDDHAGARSAPRPSSAATVAPTLVPLLSKASTPPMRDGLDAVRLAGVLARRPCSIGASGQPIAVASASAPARWRRCVAADAQRVGRHQALEVEFRLVLGRRRSVGSASWARTSQAMPFSTTRPKSPGRAGGVVQAEAARCGAARSSPRPSARRRGGASAATRGSSRLSTIAARLPKMRRLWRRRRRPSCRASRGGPG